MFSLAQIDDDDDQIEYYPSSLLTSTFLPTTETQRVPHSRDIPQELCLKMPTISNLYIYTNPPPMGYGNPGPKVAESILRAQDYNLKTQNKEVDIGPFKVNAGYWEDEEEPYPFDKVTGNWHPGEAYKIFSAFKSLYECEIRESAEETLDYIIRTNANVLTTGRQTWCPISQTSCPSPDAYLNFTKYLMENGHSDNHSLFTFAQIAHEKRDAFIFYEFEKTLRTRRSMDRRRHQIINRTISRKKRVKKRAYGDLPNQEKFLILSSTFCSYIKHGERSKLKRRAIASPNIMLRAYLNIIEFFHLSLAKRLPGTTISIGGDEKKLKILKEISLAKSSANKYFYTATQDATKFNECMNADLFCFMHLIIFNYESTTQTDVEKILMKIFTEGNFMLAIKRITLGQGPNAYNDTKTIMNKLDYFDTDISRFNENTRAWVERLRDRMDQKYVQARPGMLMGMHNAAATTVSYAPCNYRQDSSSIMYKTLRSSDDSLSVISAKDSRSLVQAITTEYLCLKLVGLNIATSKSYWVSGSIGEYNSWYLDEGFSAQYGTETSAIRPQGVSPGDDFGSCAMSTSSALAQHCINPIGAQMRLIVGIDHIRRVWRIQRKEREGITSSVQFLGDGGINPWTSMSCGLEETSIRYSNCLTDQDSLYFWRCLNPRNPFNKEPVEELTFNKEKGIMTANDVETPRTVFHYALRHNRTFRGPLSLESADNMKMSAQATAIMETANPAFKVISFQSTEKCGKYLINRLLQLQSECSDDLDLHDRNRISACINKLSGLEDEEIEEDVISDEDL